MPMKFHNTLQFHFEIEFYVETKDSELKTILKSFYASHKQCTTLTFIPMSTDSITARFMYQNT